MGKDPINYADGTRDLYNQSQILVDIYGTENQGSWLNYYGRSIQWLIFLALGGKLQSSLFLQVLVSTHELSCAKSISTRSSISSLQVAPKKLTAAKPPGIQSPNLRDSFPFKEDPAFSWLNKLSSTKGFSHQLSHEPNPTMPN